VRILITLCINEVTKEHSYPFGDIYNVNMFGSPPCPTHSLSFPSVERSWTIPSELPSWLFWDFDKSNTTLTILLHVASENVSDTDRDSCGTLWDGLDVCGGLSNYRMSGVGFNASSSNQQWGFCF
jgi:hypothetical protein